MSEFQFDAIGTGWSISTPVDLGDATRAAVLQRSAAFDADYSRFRPDSLVTGFSRAAGSRELPPDALPLLGFYRQLYEATAGAVSPLVGRVLEHLGYDADYSLRRRPGGLIAPDWDEVFGVEGTLLTSTEPLLIDIGAAGKGYLVDLLAGLLRAAGQISFVIDGSGDIAHAGPDRFRVGLEDPRDDSKVIGVANLSNAALCASATNRRRWGPDLHHIIDARTGVPVAEVIATWVVADAAMVADGLSTALFVTEPTRLAADFEFSYVRMFAAGGVEYSANFDGELFG